MNKFLITITLSHLSQVSYGVSVGEVKNKEIKKTIAKYQGLGSNWASRGAIDGQQTNHPHSDNKDVLLAQAMSEAIQLATTDCQLGYYHFRGDVRGRIQYIGIIESQTGCELANPATQNDPATYTCNAMALVNCSQVMHDHNGTPNQIIE